MNTRKALLTISLSQFTITLLSLCAIIFIVVWEIPQRNFPNYPWHSSAVRIDYWSDIFFPIINIPVVLFVIITGMNIAGISFSYLVLNKRRIFWKIEVAISTIADILFLWIAIVWVHSALICSAATLRDGGGLFGCWEISQPELWHFAIGTIISIFIITIQALWGWQLSQIIIKGGHST